MKHCPKIDNLLTPKIQVKKCPYCGCEVEFFDFELKVKCPCCGRVVERKPSEVPFQPCPRVMNCIALLEQLGYIPKSRAEELKREIREFMKALEESGGS